MSRQDLAYKAGLSETFIIKLENSTPNYSNPTWETIQQLAKALEITASDLVNVKGSNFQRS